MRRKPERSAPSAFYAKTLAQGLDAQRRIVQAEAQRSKRSLDAPPTPSGIPESFEEHVNLMFELQALAFQGDLTRVTSFMMGRELSGLSYPQIGIADGHHPISHNNYDAKQMEKKAKVDTYNLSLFANFLRRLKNTPDGDSNLLENSLFVYGSGMSDGNTHNNFSVPVVVVGGHDQQIKGNRHLKYPKGTPLANLSLSLMDKFGVNVERFGDRVGI